MAEGYAHRCQDAAGPPAKDGEQLGNLAQPSSLEFMDTMYQGPKAVPFLPCRQVRQQHPSLLEDHQDQRHQQSPEHRPHQLHPGIKTT